jgi:chromosome segregation ATPase
VVETIMIFALGFVAASLIALLIIPAINARAERLARRRAEARFPKSNTQLTAEKEELGRRAVRIEALEGALTERDKTITELENKLASTQDILGVTDQDLAQTRTFLNGTRETLSALENAHRATLDELSKTRMELDLTHGDRTRTKTDLIHTVEKLARLETQYADTDQRLTGALSELDAKRIAISDLETRLMTQTARGNDFERALKERHLELTEERKRLAELIKNIASEHERGLILEQRIREIEAERDEAQERLASQENLGSHDEELRRQITQVAAQVMKSNGKLDEPRDGNSRNQRRKKGGKQNRTAPASS